MGNLQLLGQITQRLKRSQCILARIVNIALLGRFCFGESRLFKFNYFFAKINDKNKPLSRRDEHVACQFRPLAPR